MEQGFSKNSCSIWACRRRSQDKLAGRESEIFVRRDERLEAARDIRQKRRRGLHVVKDSSSSEPAPQASPHLPIAHNFSRAGLADAVNVGLAAERSEGNIYSFEKPA